MHKGVPCGPVQGQGLGYVALKVIFFFHFKNLSPPPFSMGAGK